MDQAPGLYQHRTSLAPEHPRRLLVFDIAAKKLHKSARTPPHSTLMFAKFSPDWSRVGYVRENNLYVEDLATGRTTQLTRDGSKRIINVRLTGFMKKNWTSAMAGAGVPTAAALLTGN
jgi:hypothetical protein